MNEQLLSQLTAISGDLLDWLKTSVPAAKDFAADQIPLVIKELITYYRVSYLVTCVACLAGVGIAILGIKKIIQINKADPNCGDTSTPVISVFGGVATLIMLTVCAVNFFCYLQDTIKVWTAPRVFLIEYVTDIVQKNPRR
jgi:hypothetical protein